MKNHYWAIALILSITLGFAAGIFTESAVANDGMFTGGNSEPDNSDHTNNKFLQLKMDSEEDNYENVLNRLISIYDQKIDKNDSSVINVLTDKNFYKIFREKIPENKETISEKESRLMDYVNGKDPTLSIDIIYCWWSNQGPINYTDLSKETDVVKNINKYWSTFYFLERITKYKSYQYIFTQYKLINNGKETFEDIKFSSYTKSTTFIQII